MSSKVEVHKTDENGKDYLYERYDIDSDSGKRNGKYELFHSLYDKRRIKCFYNPNGNEERHGEYTKYYPGGDVQIRAKYENGKLIGPHRFLSAYGDIIHEEVYSSSGSGKLHGESKHFSERDGKLETKYVYNNGVIEHEKHWKDGRATEEYFFKDGNKIKQILFATSSHHRGDLYTTFYPLDPDQEGSSKPLKKYKIKEEWEEVNGEWVGESKIYNREGKLIGKTKYSPSGHVKVYDEAYFNGEWLCINYDKEGKSQKEWYEKRNGDGEMIEYCEKANNGKTLFSKVLVEDANDSPYWSCEKYCDDPYFKEKTWHENKDGKIHGEYRRWWKNGKKAVEVNYKEGKNHGACKSWDDGETLVKHSEFKDGVLVKEKLLSFGDDNIWSCTEWFSPIGEEKKLKCSWTEKISSGVGKKCGEYKEYYKSGKLFLKGTYRDGKKHGDFVALSEEGVEKAKGKFVNGKEDGEHKSWSGLGTLMGVTTYKDGLMLMQKEMNDPCKVPKHRRWHCQEWFPYTCNEFGKLKRVWDENSSSGVGERVGKYTEWLSPVDGGHKYIECNYSESGNEKYDGEYKAYWKNGNIHFICHYSSSGSGKKHGKHSSWWENGKKCLEINYKDGEKHGEYKEWDDGILVDISEFKDDWLLKEKKWGKETLVWTCREWFPPESGEKKLECLWTENKDGKKHGEYKDYWGNGNIFHICYYKDGERHGKYKQWEDDEILVDISEFKDGCLLKEKKWGKETLVWTCKEWFPSSSCESGEKKLKWSWTENKDGELHGEYKAYWKSGKIYFICHYKDGKKHGRYSSWWESGGKCQERNYKDGKSHGEYKMWGDEILVDISEYKDDYLLKEKKWGKETLVWTCKEWFPPSCRSGERKLKFLWTENKNGERVREFGEWSECGALIEYSIPYSKEKLKNEESSQNLESRLNCALAKSKNFIKFPPTSSNETESKRLYNKCRIKSLFSYKKDGKLMLDIFYDTEDGTFAKEVHVDGEEQLKRVEEFIAKLNE